MFGLVDRDYARFVAALERAQEAVKLAPTSKEKAAACMVALPDLVREVEQIAMYHTEIQDTFRTLKEYVEAFLSDVRKAQKMHPEVTYLSGQVRQALKRIEELLERMSRLHFQAK